MASKKAKARSSMKADLMKRFKGRADLARYSEDTRERFASEFANLAREVGVNKLLKEITKPRGGSRGSVFGRKALGDFVRQYSPTQLTISNLKKMETEGQVALGIAAYQAPVIGSLGEVPEVRSDDPEVKSFVTSMLRKTWRSVVRSSVEGMSYGFQAHEKLFERSDFSWGWPTVEDGEEVWKERTIEKAWVLKRFKDLDPASGIQVWVDKDTESFAGFTVGKKMDMEELVPAEKAFFYTSRKRWGNLYGRARLVPAYEPWYEFNAIKWFSNRYYERFGEPGIVVKHDPNPVMDMNATREEYSGEYAIAAAEAYKGTGIVALPTQFDERTEKELYDFKLLTDDKRGDTWVRRMDFDLKRILRALLVPERTLTQDAATGSYGMAQSHLDFFLQMEQEEVESIVEHQNLYVVPQIVDLNLGKNAAEAYIVAPKVTGVDLELMGRLLETIMKDEPSARDFLDINEMLLKLAVPTKEVEEEEGEEEEEKPAAEQEKIEVSTKGEEAELQREAESEAERRLDGRVGKMMARVEQTLDERSEPVKEKVYSYEDAMRDAALGFLEKAKRDDEGRLAKRGNAEALAKVNKGIKATGREMRRFFGSDEGAKTQTYLKEFRDEGLDDFASLADFYEVTLPRGWKGQVREEKLAKFGAGRESFLINIERIDTREGSKLREMLQEGADRREIADAVMNDDASVKELVERMFDAEARTAAAKAETAAAAKHMRAIAGKTAKVEPLFNSKNVRKLRGERIRKQRQAVRKLASRRKATQRAGRILREEAEKLQRRAAAALKQAQTRAIQEVRAEAALDKLAKKLSGPEFEAVKGATARVEKAVRGVTLKTSLPERIGAWKFHDGYVDLTTEAPARGAYRWSLWAAASLAGWGLWKAYSNPRTEEVGGKRAAASEEDSGEVATLSWWNKRGEARGSAEPIQLYGMHYGERDYYMPIPEEWAEKEGIEWKE